MSTFSTRTVRLRPSSSAMVTTSPGSTSRWVQARCHAWLVRSAQARKHWRSATSLASVGVRVSGRSRVASLRDCIVAEGAEIRLTVWVPMSPSRSSSV